MLAKSPKIDLQLSWVHPLPLLAFGARVRVAVVAGFEVWGEVAFLSLDSPGSSPSILPSSFFPSQYNTANAASFWRPG